MINCTSFYLHTTNCLAQGQIDGVYSGSAEPGKWMLMTCMRHSRGLQVLVFGGQTQINHLYRLQPSPECLSKLSKLVKWRRIKVESSGNSKAANNLSGEISNLRLHLHCVLNKRCSLSTCGVSDL